MGLGVLTTRPSVALTTLGVALPPALGAGKRMPGYSSIWSAKAMRTNLRSEESEQ